MMDFDRQIPQLVPPGRQVLLAQLPNAKHAAEAGSTRLDRWNTAMRWVLCAFVILTPIPYGATSALAWIGAALVLSLAGGVYFLARAYRAPRLRLRLRGHAGLVWLGGAVLLAAAVGCVPHFGEPLLSVPESVQPDHISLATGPGQLALLRLATYGMLFVLMTEVCTGPRRAERMMTVLYAGFVAHAVWALLSLHLLGDRLLLQEKAAYHGVATGTFVNRNSFASFMAMGAVMGVVRLLPVMPSAGDLLVTVKRPSGRYIMLQVLGLLVIFGALAATGSRMGVFSALIAVGSVICLFAVKTGSLGRKTALCLGLGAFVFAAIVLSIFGQATLDRLIFVPVDWDARLALYQQTWSMILARPWTGYGVDGFHVAFELFHRPDLRMDRTWHLPHNTYLSLWVEYGIPLGSLTLALITVLFIKLLRTVLQCQPGCGTALTGCGVIILAAVHSLADFSFEIPANAYAFIALTSLGLVAARRQDRLGEAATIRRPSVGQEI